MKSADFVVPRPAPPSTNPATSHLVKGGCAERIQPRAAPRLRIGFITPNLLCGGVEHWLLALVRYSRSSLSWSVAVTNAEAVEPAMRMQVEEFAKVAVGSKAAEQLCSQVDVVVAWGIHDLAPLLTGFRGPVVVVSHGCGAWTESFLAACRNRATHFAAVSRAAAGAIPHAEVKVIPNGVDPLRCQALRPRQMVREEWGLSFHEIALGFVGRLSPEKNPLAVSRAARVLGPGYRAVYVGPGYGEDFRPAARRLTPDAIFIPPTSHIGDALGALDCLIMASPAEGYSLVVMESLAAGLPVVATPVGIVPELLCDHALHLETVPIHPTPEQLAAAALRAISPTNRGYVEKARIVALTHYHAETMARRWTEFVSSISQASVEAVLNVLYKWRGTTP